LVSGFLRDPSGFVSRHSRVIGLVLILVGVGVSVSAVRVAWSKQVSICEGPAFAEAKVPGDPRLWLELALTTEQQARGLMFRESMPENQGMLFVFGQRTAGAFWMHNTLIPLSIAYIDRDGAVLDIQDMQPQTDDPHPPARPYWYALEVNQGWFANHGVAVGSTFAFCLPPG